MIYESIDSCRICGSSSLETVFSYQTHIGDAYRVARNQAKAEPWVPLSLVFCYECGHLQIRETIEPSFLYSNYLYRTATSPYLKQDYLQEALQLISLVPLREEDLILEIGSNDGASLLPFQERNFRVVGVEPAKEAASVSSSLGVETVNDFFHPKLVETLTSSHGQADVIMCKYTLANIDDPQAWAQAFAKLLTSKGVLAITTGYHPMQFDISMFEFVNHDHIHYFTITSLERILSAAGLEIFDVEAIAHKGGSIRVLARRATKGDSRVNQWLQRERWQRLRNFDYYTDFKNKMYKRRDDFWAFARSQGVDNDGNWVGVGASISTTHLRDFYELDSQLMYLMDDDSNKIGRFSPGAALEVKPIAAATKGNAALLPVILAWQHEDVLKRRLLEENYSGPVIDVLPRPQLTRLGGGQ